MGDWPKLLYTYGPFALLIFLVFVIENKARGALKDTNISRSISVPVYVLNWLMIFILCVVVTYTWYLINLPQEAMIQGTFENLKENEMVFSESGNLYLVRNYQPGKNQFGYNWRLIAPRRLPDGTKQSIYLTEGQGDNSHSFRYELTIHSSFYQSPVRIVYERKVTKLLVDHEGKQEEVLPTEDAEVQQPRFPSSGFLPVVYAQSSDSLDAIFERLESDDPIIRSDARKALAALGQSALPRIEKILRDPKTSYRLRLGVIAALNDMPNVAVSPEARTVIENAAKKENDPVLSSEASRYLYKLPAPTCGIRCGAERWMIKSLTDPDAAKVNFSYKETTVADLIHLPRPPVISQTQRAAPVELQTYRIKALLIRYKKETDHDYKLVVADPNDPSHTMVAEIPDPQCSSVCSSAYLRQISEARTMFVKRFSDLGPQISHPNSTVSVIITGVGFWDYRHGSFGAAPNDFEIHPVLNIQFTD